MPLHNRTTQTIGDGEQFSGTSPYWNNKLNKFRDSDSYFVTNYNNLDSINLSNGWTTTQLQSSTGIYSTNNPFQEARQALTNLKALNDRIENQLALDQKLSGHIHYFGDNLANFDALDASDSNRYKDDHGMHIKFGTTSSEAPPTGFAKPDFQVAFITVGAMVYGLPIHQKQEMHFTTYKPNLKRITFGESLNYSSPLGSYPREWTSFLIYTLWGKDLPL